MRDRVEALEEEQPCADVGGSALGWQHVEENPGAPVLALAQNRDANSDSDRDDQDQFRDDVESGNHWWSSWSGMNPSMCGPGLPTFRSLTWPQPTTFISRKVGWPDPHIEGF